MYCQNSYVQCFIKCLASVFCTCFIFIELLDTDLGVGSLCFWQLSSSDDQFIVFCSICFLAQIVCCSFFVVFFFWYFPPLVFLSAWLLYVICLYVFSSPL